MTPDPETILLDELHAQRDDLSASRRLKRTLAAELAPMQDKAEWCYLRCCQATGRRPDPLFHGAFLDAWVEYYLYAAHARQVPDLPFELRPRTIWFTCHQPEIPLMFPLIRARGILSLLAQTPDWMVDRIGPANLLAFREVGASVRLLRAFQEGRSIGAMLDYCYDETRAVTAPFLGFECRTPAGLLTLACRFEYDLALLDVSEGVPKILSLRPATGPVEHLAALLNAELSAIIWREPARWLLWPSLDRRWPALPPNGV